ncbi:sigma-70 family RNA polymerase sigma factor [Pirellulaceae bacterium]|jgi:RNA polymerase sigma-70 factor, ECF subfamily|nr:sigma-70 family RNA polymerase sigma factor [Pirellulaceae bacterium]
MSSEINQANPPSVNRNVDNDILLLREAIASKSGDQAIVKLFLKFRPQLKRVVEFRMDSRIRSRADADDVLQEAFLIVKDRFTEFVEAPGVSLFIWLRQHTLQVLIEFQRRHFRKKRTVEREERLQLPVTFSGTSKLIARELIGQLTSPSQAAIKNQELEQLNESLESMGETDREILAMRHFEQLTNNEVAQILNIKPAASSNRYVRALTRLGELMTQLEK